MNFWIPVERECKWHVVELIFDSSHTINRNMKAFALAIVAAEYVLKMLPRGTHEYAKLIQPHELAAYCREAELELRQAKGLSYSPLTKRYSLGADTSVNYLFATQRVI